MSTTKSIIQIRGTKLAAMLANSIYYAFYTIIIIFTVAKFTDNEILNIIIKIIITFITNMLGTFISMTIIEKLRKDKLWKIELTTHTEYAEEIHQQLKAIPHSFIIINDKHTVFAVYCETGHDSDHVKNICAKYKVKYFISEHV